MQHYLAIVEEGDENHAYGIWFPDVRGCFSGGDTFEEAMRNAPEALSVHLQLLIEDGGELPTPRSLAELRADLDVSEDLKNNLVAIVPLKGITFRSNRLAGVVKRRVRSPSVKPVAKKFG